MIEFIKKAVEKAIGRQVDFDVSASEKEDFGHYSTNLAFRLNSQIHADSPQNNAEKTPFEIAKKLAEKLDEESDMFLKVEAVQPGFVNFWLKPEVLQEELKNILTKKQETRDKRQGLKINLEFVSANPTGPLTMANGRGGFYGDVLARILENAGHKVTREYYINDTGNQIKLLGESVLAALRKIPDKEGHYKGEYIKDLARNKVILRPIQFTQGRPEEFEGRQAQDERDADKIGKKAAVILLKKIRIALKSAGIKHGVWFSEDKNLHKKGELKKTLQFLENKSLIKKKDGALWLGDGVLIKSDGNPTYFLADLAYHYDKFLKRKFDLAIDIWGADHHGYAQRMKKGVEALGVKSERLKILITQLVRLVSGGKEVKMSKRKGEFVTLDELLKEVGADAARFFFLMHSLDTHMDFDLDLAKERSRKNPVYYTQYALVRAQSILRKSKFQAPKPKQIQNSKILNNLNSDSEIKLMLELVKLPDVLMQTAEDYQVHRLTKYAMGLTKSFHNFYEKERVLGPVRSSPPMGPSDRASAGEASNGMGVELQSARLALVLATKIVLENLFNILGISKPIKM